MNVIGFDESGVLVNGQSGWIVAASFNLHRADSSGGTEPAQFDHRGFTKAGATKGFLYKEVLDDCDPAAIGHAVAKDHDDVSDVNGVRLNEPDIAGAFIA